MVQYISLILCLLSGLLPAYGAVPEELRGTVTDAATGEAVIGCIVRSKGAFTSTGNDGRFLLKLKAGADSVSFRSMGYESMTLSVHSDISTVRLTPKVSQLRDVIVEAPDIYAKGDTLVFNVERYATSKDNAIIDVIKRLPGIKVEEDGTIKYQGKPINKFYLDGNDFIGGQYNLATDNISHKDVASVEVMENHQPVKALEGIEFSEEAGINLKLKEEARSRWVGFIQAGAGASPFLYNGGLFAMRIAPKFQNIITLKADNTGWNPANEISDHDFGGMFSSDYAPTLWPEYISADIINAPLSEKRTRDNRSWLANAITSLKSGDTSMRLILNYMGDRLDYASGFTTDYLSTDIPPFIQNGTQRIDTHDLSAQFYSETNKRGYYLKDKITLSGKWDSSLSDITGSYNLDQGVDRKHLKINNDLKLVKRNEKRLLTLVSRNSFEHRPDRLLVAGDKDAVQKLGTNDFRSTTETRFGRLTRFWKYYITAGLDLDYHSINAMLAGLGIYDNRGIHESLQTDLFATPQIDYERKAWRGSIQLPLKWIHQSLGSLHDYINISPGVSLIRQLTAKSELSSSLSYSLGSPQTYLNFNVPVLSDYRNLFIAYNPDKYSHAVTATLSFRYRNPLKSLFINLSTTYSHSRSAIMSNQLFEGDLIISTYADHISKNGTWQINGGFSKGLGHSRIVTGCDINTSLSTASSMRDNTVIPYRQTCISVKPYFRGSLLTWLSVNYEADYRFTRMRICANTDISHTLRQNLFATISLNDNLHMTICAEHFLTRFPEGNSSGLMLMDASAIWRINSNTRLSLTADNLLNRRTYKYVTYGTLSCTERHFQIRSRALLVSLQYRL